MSAARALDVAIVSFRCEDLLRRCLASLREHPPASPMLPRVVDNDSGDGTAEMVAREFPDVELTVNERNEGFARASNQAIAAGDSPYVLCLNPDCEVGPGTIDRLLDAMDEHPEAGACGPSLLRPDGSADHAARRGFPTPLNSLGHFTGIARRRRAPAAMRGYAPGFAEPGPADSVNGAFMLMRRRALDQVGLFDEGYWMYMEDLDLSYRLRQAGWITWYEPSAVAIHLKGGSAGEVRSPRLAYAFHRGMWRFYRKHQARERSAPANLAVAAGIALKGGVAILRGAVSRRRGLSPRR